MSVPSRWADTLAALSDGGLDMPGMISHHIGLAEIPGMFADLSERRIAYRKIMITPESV